MDTLKISETIKAKRREREYTQEELANILGATKAAVSKWETGSGCPDRHGSALQQSAPQYTHDLPLR